MKKIVIAVVLVLILILCLAVWCLYRLGEQENRYIRCGRGHRED